MKKLITCFVLIFIGSVLVIQLTRYTHTQMAIVFEWFAILALLLFIVLSIWASGRYLFAGKTEADSVPKTNLEASIQFGISKRELEVLSLISDGLSNRQISERLFVSESTVKKHVSNIFSKLDARRRTEAIRIAYENNLIKSRPVVSE